MNGKIWLISAATLLLAVAPLSAAAGPCDAYFTFDDTLADASGNGYDGEMIGKGGELSAPSYTEGKFGKALMLDGNAAMRALLDLHWDGCPQVTISAWVNVSRGAPNDAMRVLSTGGGNGPGMTISGAGLTLRGTGNGLHQQQAIRQGSWMFVVGVYDYTAGEYFLYGGGRTPTPGKLSEKFYEPQNAIWVGTEHDDWGIFARGVAIDDLRITGRRLEEPQITALRSSRPNNADTATGSTGESVAGGSTQGPSTPSACGAQSNCPAGNYCAVDNICYPNSQLPRDYVAATAPTGGPGRPELDVSNPSTIPDADDLLAGSGNGATDSGSGGSSAGPGLPNPNSGPADELAPDVSAGQVMAGRWTYDLDTAANGSSGAIIHTTLKIYGRDNALSGTITTTSGAVNDEPLTNISKLGNTVSFSSPSYGTWSGQVFDNERMMSLLPTTPNMSARLFRKRPSMEEPEDTSAASGGFGSGDGTGLTLREYLDSFAYNGEPTGDVRQCTSFSEVVADIATTARDAVVDVAVRNGCARIREVVSQSQSAQRLVLSGGELSTSNLRSASFHDEIISEVYDACVAGTTAAAQIPDQLLGFWNNTIANGGWATIGPRELKIATSHEGDLRAPGDRKFVTAGPLMWTNNVLVGLQELSGKARTHVRVCTVSMHNHYTQHHLSTFNETPEERQNTNQTMFKNLNGINWNFLIVKLDAEGTSNRHFKYELNVYRN